MWQRSYFYVRNVATRGDWVNLLACKAGPPAGRLPNWSYRARSLTPVGAGAIARLRVLTQSEGLTGADLLAAFVARADELAEAYGDRFRPTDRLREMAELYADPKTKVVSFWTMGFNQHTRGVWANNLVYNIHLLTGKIAEPGNSPFSLTGQPSACGTAREVGTFSHRLPADMLVANKLHRDKAEEICAVEGLSGVLIGPSDLSKSMTP